MKQRLEDSNSILEEYVQSMKTEVNPSDAYVKNSLKILKRIDLLTATKESIIKFLDLLRKSEAEDPLHKWI